MNFNLDLMLPYKDEVKAAVNRVIDSRQYIYGPELEAFEAEFAAFTGQRHVVGVGNGTDAIRIALLALGIGPGDEVISPAFNVGYTALAVQAVGAKNVFVDVDPKTLLIDPAKVLEAITPKTRAIIPVHLYGRVCDMALLKGIARKHGLLLVEDAAQAHGDPGVGVYSDAVAYSFYPTKNLGALGEAGAVVTNIDSVAATARLLRNAGRTDRYAHVLAGINSGLDEIQAAVLRVKLPYLNQRNEARRWAAAYYRNLLERRLGWLAVNPARSVYHLYVVKVEQRDQLHEHLTSVGIPTLIHYPIPVPYQPIFASKAFDQKGWPVSEQAARSVLSLPMHADIMLDEQVKVVDAIVDFYENHVS